MLLREVQRLGFFESEETTALRRECIGSLRRLINKWSETYFKGGRCLLLEFGSFYLNVHGKDADLDVCVVRIAYLNIKNASH